MKRAYLEKKTIVSDNAEYLAAEPVTVDELKTYMQLEGTAYDAPLEIFIKAARKKIENYCNVSLVSKQITAFFFTVGASEMKLPFSPVDTVTEVTHKDCCDWEVLDIYGWCAMGDGVTAKNTCGKHKVTYTTTADTSDVFKQAILMQAGYQYSQRDEANAPDWNPQAKAMIDEERNISV